ncbi:hypothetical protein [Sinorhizobium meliloti]|uniref:hypothetical protein n=1 Tax=Rhizobium meliloti TaxID=382 RepID=UPI003F1692AD
MPVFSTAAASRVFLQIVPAPARAGNLRKATASFPTWGDRAAAAAHQWLGAGDDVIDLAAHRLIEDPRALGKCMRQPAADVQDFCGIEQAQTCVAKWRSAEPRR